MEVCFDYVKEICGLLLVQGFVHSCFQVWSVLWQLQLSPFFLSLVVLSAEIQCYTRDERRRMYHSYCMELGCAMLCISCRFWPLARKGR